MALVTGFYLQSDGTSLPASTVPLVVATPSEPFITLDGRTISQEPQTVTPHATTGAYTFDIEPTVDALKRGVHYRIVGTYLDADGYGTTGHARKDFFEQKIIVPLEGGSVGDLTVLVDDRGYYAEGPTPPSISIRWLYIEPSYDPNSGDPLPTYTDPDSGITITHGTFVDWSA